MLGQLGSALDIGSLPAPPTLPAPLTFPSECSFSNQILTPLDIGHGSIVIDPTSGSITISLTNLLKELKLDINTLPANTDLVSYLLKYITDPTLLAQGLQDALNSLSDSVSASFEKCTDAIAKQGGLGVLLKTLTDALTAGQSMLNMTITSITGALGNAGGPNPLQPLADALKNVIDIGVNVESGPGIQKEQSDPDLKFATKLNKTPNQNTPVVQNQTLIRALEINVLDTTSVAGNFSTSKLAAPLAAPSLPGGLGLPGGAGPAYPLPVRGRP